jgi:hypothetical protein
MFRIASLQGQLDAKANELEAAQIQLLEMQVRRDLFTQGN